MNSQSNIQVVIFDLGRVLVDINNTFLIDTFFKGFDADDRQELGRRTMSDPLMVEFNCGRIPPEEFHRRMCQTYQLELDYAAFKTLWCKIFFTMEGMEELVGTLSRYVPVGLLSDTDPVHWYYIKTTWPWIGAIQKPTLSYEVGAMKPNAEIYLAASQNVGVPPEQCLFIDDLQINVEGARAAGMNAIRFETAAKLRDQLQPLIAHSAK